MLGVREGVGELNSMAKEDFTLEPSRDVQRKKSNQL